MSDETVDAVREAFQRSPGKSTRRASNELRVPQSTIVTVLHTNLKARITDVFARITEDMLENTWREIDYRLDVLRATKGAHVEVYQSAVKKTS